MLYVSNRGLDDEKNKLRGKLSSAEN
jgi:hypothetical protein